MPRSIDSSPVASASSFLTLWTLLTLWAPAGGPVVGPCSAAVAAEPLPAAERLTLAADGRTSYVIVTAERPTPEEATAAEWLATALKKVAGVEFPVRPENSADLPATRLAIGDTAAARDAGCDSSKLPPEAWRIKPVGTTLILAGGRPRGAIYAVTEFLETEIGVLLLDPFTEVAPSRPELTVRVAERSGRPAFPVRAVFTGFPYTRPAQAGRLIEKYRVWNKNVIDGRPAVGDHARMIPTGVHSFGNFISSKEFAAEHPEYFGMDAAGKRVTDDLGSPSAWTQLCVTNPDVRRIVLERARQFLRDDRIAAQKEGREPARWLVLSQNDNTTNLCLCPNCKAVADREGSESGPLVDFVNHTARGLRDEFPEVRVQTEAYNFTIKAPQSLVPEPNVVVRYCDNYGRSDLTRPLEDPRNARMLDIFDGWRRKSCKLGVWDYWRTFQSHPPGFFAPSTNVRAIAEDVRMFRRSGVELMTIEIEDLFGAGLNDSPTSADLQSFMPLRTWIGLKLIDDPDKRLDALLDIFCRGYYGDAAGPMRRLLDRIERRQSELTTRVVDVQRQVWAERLCDAEFFADAFRLFDEALQATRNDEQRAIRVRRERLVVDSSFLWLETHVRRGAGARSSDLPDRDEVLRRHRDDWRAYLATVFDEEGQKLALPIMEAGVDLAAKLKPEDTNFEDRPLAVPASAVQLDGRLNEAFWSDAPTARLLPRDPGRLNDDPTVIRLAWSSEALYLGVEQPVESASATLGVSLMAADRRGVQLSLYSPRAEGLQTPSAYFYDYDPDGGLRLVKDRRAESRCARATVDGKATLEMRFLWSDLGERTDDRPEGPGKRDFLMNVEAYPLADSKAPGLVSSPWLIGSSPTWHSGYFKALRLDPAASAKPAP